MPIEAATYIDDLVPANPVSADGIAEGDDHIRLLKQVLQNTFPNITSAMSVSHTVLNGLDGRVTTLETNVGLLDNGASVVPISGVLEQAEPVNAQTGVNYTVVTGDRGRLITRTNASAMTDTLPQAGASFPAGWFCFVENLHASNLLTLNVTLSTINGAASIIVFPGFRLKITSDGTNYRGQLVSITGGAWRRSALSGAYTILPTDVRPPTIFDYTTAGFTISTNVAASNFTGQPFVVRNSAASGVVTFDPNSTETIDGATTLTINPGETYVIFSDGTNYKSIASRVDFKFPAVATKTGNYTATTADRNKSLRFASLSGDATLTLPAAATAGDGFMLFVSNEDSDISRGLIIDPNGAELIDGFSTRKTYPTTRLTLICDGTGWRTVSGYYRFISAAVVRSGGTLSTLPHSLGVRPKRVWMEGHCTTADAGYSIGDIIQLPLHESNDAGSLGFSVITDATNLVVRHGTGSGVYYPNKSTGAGAFLSNSDWAWRFYAEE